MHDKYVSGCENSNKKPEPKYFIKIFPKANDRHLSPIYAGLYDLLELNKIRLAFSQDFSNVPTDLDAKRLWMEVRDIKTGFTRKLCFDMRDGSRNLAIDCIEKADTYFKRSYDFRILNSLDNSLQKKIRPYGLYYPCRSIHENIYLTFKRLYLHNKISDNFLNNPYYALKSTAGYPFKLFLENRFTNTSNSQLYPFSTAFEVSSKEPADHFVLFLTKVWNTHDVSPNNASKLKDLNDMRVETIRALRSKFKDRFIGGLKRTSFSEKYYPDCVSSLKTDKYNFIKILKKCLIAVTTSGLHESVGAKLAEYIVASRCVVTESLKQTFPTPLYERKNILTFNTPDTCVDACQRILDNPNLANEMRKNNEEYYNIELKPSVRMFKHLQTAFRPEVHAELSASEFLNSALTETATNNNATNNSLR